MVVVVVVLQEPLRLRFHQNVFFFQLVATQTLLTTLTLFTAVHLQYLTITLLITLKKITIILALLTIFNY